MNLKILYDNEAKPGFKSGWGFSCLVGLEDEKILFDTGQDGNILLSNMERFGIRLREIKRVVLTHAHWDHVGGLTHVRGREMHIHVPHSFPRNELASRFNLHEVKDAREIRDGIWTTGELVKEIKEQSLIVKTGKRLVVLVGCSHPGIRDIFSAASKFGRIWGVVGGMHGFEDYEALKDLSLIIPTHCTANKEKIVKLFPEKYVKGKAGLEIELE